jgi:hypothetical protein
MKQVAQYSAESLRLTGGLVEFFKKCQEVHLQQAKSLRKFLLFLIIEICCNEFIQFTKQKNPTVVREHVVFGKKETITVTDLLMDTSLWKGVVDYMHSTIRSCKAEQTQWQSFIENSVDPLGKEINSWSDDSKIVSQGGNVLVSRKSERCIYKDS